MGYYFDSLPLATRAADCTTAFAFLCSPQGLAVIDGCVRSPPSLERVAECIFCWPLFAVLHPRDVPSTERRGVVDRQLHTKLPGEYRDACLVVLDVVLNRLRRRLPTRLSGVTAAWLIELQPNRMEPFAQRTLHYDRHGELLVTVTVAGDGVIQIARFLRASQEVGQCYSLFDTCQHTHRHAVQAGAHARYSITFRLSPPPPLANLPASLPPSPPSSVAIDPAGRGCWHNALVLASSVAARMEAAVVSVDATCRELASSLGVDLTSADTRAESTASALYTALARCVALSELAPPAPSPPSPPSSPPPLGSAEPAQLTLPQPLQGNGERWHLFPCVAHSFTSYARRVLLPALYAVDLRTHHEQRMLSALMNDARGHWPVNEKDRLDNNFEVRYAQPVRAKRLLISQLCRDSQQLGARIRSCERLATVLGEHHREHPLLVRSVTSRYHSFELAPRSPLRICEDCGWLAELQSVWQTGEGTTEMSIVRWYDEVFYAHNTRFVDWPRATPGEWWWIAVEDESGDPGTHVSQRYHCFARPASLRVHAEVADICVVMCLRELLDIQRFLHLRGIDMFACDLYMWVAPSLEAQVGREFVEITWADFVRRAQAEDPTNWDPLCPSYSPPVPISQLPAVAITHGRAPNVVPLVLPSPPSSPPASSPPPSNPPSPPSSPPQLPTLEFAQAVLAMHSDDDDSPRSVAVSAIGGDVIDSAPVLVHVRTDTRWTAGQSFHYWPPSMTSSYIIKECMTLMTHMSCASLAP